MLSGGDCDITHIPTDSEGLEDEADYPYKFLQTDSFRNREAARLLDILKQKNTLSTAHAPTSLAILRTLKSFNGKSNATRDYTGENFHETNRTIDVTSTVSNESYTSYTNPDTMSNIVEMERKGSLRRFRNDDIINLVRVNNAKPRKIKPVNQFKHKSRRLDTYAESLLYVNRIYNTAYGFERRRVPAHMPHLLDKWIVAEMQEKFEHEFKKTSSHRVRDSEDMQFAFSYFYYLISERRKATVGEIFDKFDTDKSG